MNTETLNRRVAALESAESGDDTLTMVQRHWLKVGAEPQPPLAPLPDYVEGEPVYLSILRKGRDQETATP